jgi:hypothetical protein
MNIYPCGTHTQMRRAQDAYDNRAELEPDDEVDERIYAIEEAQRLLTLATKELALHGSAGCSRADQMMAEAAGFLIAEE